MAFDVHAGGGGLAGRGRSVSFADEDVGAAATGGSDTEVKEVLPVSSSGGAASAEDAAVAVEAVEEAESVTTEGTNQEVRGQLHN